MATTLLSRKLRVAISYEEPAWESKQDLSEAGKYPGNEKMAARDAARLIPRGGSFDVIIPSNSPDPLAVIEAALASHRNVRNPGEFKLISFGLGEFAIVPDRAGDKDGKMVQKSSPLDLRISLPEQERTFPATIGAVLQAVQSAGGVSVIMWTHLNDTLYQKRRVGAKNEKARDVLARAINVPGGQKFSWNLRSTPRVRATRSVWLVYKKRCQSQGEAPDYGLPFGPNVNLNELVRAMSREIGDREQFRGEKLLSVTNFCVGSQARDSGHDQRDPRYGCRPLCAASRGGIREMNAKGYMISSKLLKTSGHRDRSLLP